MKRDNAKTLIDAGLEQLHEALGQGQSETLQRYLEVMSRFHRYSFRNLMLILLQRPSSTNVAGFNRWKDLGRYVRKGEKGIGILAPCRYKRKAEEDDKETEVHDIRGFKVVYVFDVSQTEGEELPEFAQVHGDPGENLARIERVIRDAGITLEYGPLELGVKGVSSGGAITIRKGLDPAERFAVAVHEYSHELVHKGERRHETTITVRETEAEAIAFVVCSAFGMDSVTRSSDYIQLHRGGTETLADSLAFIQKTAADIIDAVSAAELPCHERTYSPSTISYQETSV